MGGVSGTETGADVKRLLQTYILARNDAAKVVNLGQHSNRETVAVLEDLLMRALRGEITGLVFGIYENRQHRYGTTDYYTSHPVVALGAVSRIKSILNDLAEDSQEEK
jgi:hypothetical protein